MSSDPFAPSHGFVSALLAAIGALATAIVALWRRNSSIQDEHKADLRQHARDAETREAELERLLRDQTEANRALADAMRDKAATDLPPSPPRLPNRRQS
jgi:formiminotetrahydrofolate cyclodeaminase